MLRLVLLACLLAAAAAVPTQGSDTEFCNGITECPSDCGYVSRNEKCVFCNCGDSPLIQTGPKPLPEPEPQCKYGPAIIDECDNDCKCIRDGRYGCSRKLCMDGQRPEQPKNCSNAKDLPKRDNQRVFCHDGIIKVQSLDAKCLPGAAFMDKEDCNSCMCSSAGIAACTLKVCLKDEGKPPASGCPYGPGFIDECNNDCNCVDGKFYGCTFKACNPGEKAQSPMKCTSSDNLPSRAGVRVFCDDGIVKLQKIEPQCKYGPAIIDECDNDCKCIRDGRYGCSRKLCMDGQRPEQPKNCSNAKDLPKRDNQRVFCHDGIIKVQSLDAKCLPGAAFMDKEDCNSCMCSSTGIAACTLKFCLKDEEKPPAPGCPYGPGFIDECNNDCNCVDGQFYGCTFKACKPGEKAQSPMKCTSSDNLPSRAGVRVFCDDGIVKTQQPVCPHGPEFIDECGNDCRCLVDGYACTKKSCKPGQTVMKPKACEGVKDLPGREGRRVICHENITKIQNEDDTCLPGSVYGLECNSCFCSDTGKSGCTLMACIGEPTASTVTCEDGLPSCPADCGQVYNELRDCYDCPCGVGKPGDVAVQFGEPCPAGTVFSSAGAFFRTCKPSDKCPHGLAFIDECDNDCGCAAGGYGCTRKACLPGQKTTQPKQCKGSSQLPKRENKRVFCHDGIVKVQDKDESCIPGSLFKEECNNCFCGEGGHGCTLKECPVDSNR